LGWSYALFKRFQIVQVGLPRLSAASGKGFKPCNPVLREQAMPEETPDIYAILESFLRENLSSKYEPKDLDGLVEVAKKLLKGAMEAEARRKEAEGPGPTPRKPVYVREPDIEDKLLESLKQSIKREEDS